MQVLPAIRRKTHHRKRSKHVSFKPVLVLVSISFALSIYAHADEFEPWFLKIESRDILLKESIARSIYSENRKPADFSTSTPLNAIALYHRYFSRSNCQFYPSCSRYGYKSISKYGFIKGTILESERLVRCNSKARAYGYEQVGQFLYDPPRDFWHYRYEDKKTYSAAEFIAARLMAEEEVSPQRQDTSGELYFQLFDDVVADGRLKFAFYLYNERDLYRAVTEFKHYMVENPDSDSVPAVYFMLAFCYLHAERYDEALRYFKWAKAKSRQDELQALAQYMQGVTQYLSGAYKSAIQTADNIVRDGKSSRDLVEKAHLFASLCYLRNNDIPGALRKLQMVASSSKNPEIEKFAGEAIAIIKEDMDERKRSPAISMVMSTILPGSGQIYSGRYRDGITSLVLNGVFTAIAVDSYRQRNWGGGLIVAYFGLSFYAGNIYGAKASAHRHNEQIMDRMIQQTEQTLSTQKLSTDVRTRNDGVYICWDMIR